MTARNPYETPKSNVAEVASTARRHDVARRRRVLKALIGSGIAAIAGFLAGVMGATLYEQHYYPNDPDPVDFNIGAIFLLLWLGVWVLGTALAAWLAFRRLSTNAA